MSSALGPGSTLGGKYRLLERLAGGGMGSVWLAKHEVLDAEVAVKLMSSLLADTPSAKARFEREAKASAQLKSLHICKVQDYGIEGDTPYMVMERLEGEDLAERLNRRGRIPADELAGIVSQIARALTVAHAAGLVHRDLKPSNVFVVHEGDSEIVKLLDFGIAREMQNQLVDDRTSSGMVIGSPHHMSPEQAHGQPVDHRSDLWSLGVIMYKALTGHRPFEGEHMTAVMLRIVSTTPPAPSTLCDDLPAGTDAFFERALARDVSERFQSASELAEAFAELSTGKAPAAWLSSAEPRDALASRPSSLSGAASGATPMSGASLSTEGTGSRELRAVTSGTGGSIALPKTPLARRALPWAVAFAAVVASGLALATRGGGASAPSPPAPSATSASATAGPAADTTRLLGSASVSAPIASGDASPPLVTPALTASSSAPAATPSGRATPSSRPLTPSSKPPAANAGGGKVDPFTGLPIP